MSKLSFSEKPEEIRHHWTSGGIWCQICKKIHLNLPSHVNFSDLKVARNTGISFILTPEFYDILESSIHEASGQTWSLQWCSPHHKGYFQHNYFFCNIFSFWTSHLIHKLFFHMDILSFFTWGKPHPALWVVTNTSHLQVLISFPSLVIFLGIKKTVPLFYSKKVHLGYWHTHGYMFTLWLPYMEYYEE